MKDKDFNEIIEGMIERSKMKQNLEKFYKYLCNEKYKIEQEKEKRKKIIEIQRENENYLVILYNIQLIEVENKKYEIINKLIKQYEEHKTEKLKEILEKILIDEQFENLLEIIRIDDNERVILSSLREDISKLHILKEMRIYLKMLYENL